MKISNPLFLIIFSFNVSFAQNRSFGTLPIIQKDSNFQNNETGNLNDTPDYSRILNIYQRLINARGDFRYLVPKLYLKQEESHVASIDYNKSEIVLEKKAYDVCSKFGDAAIAFLLAHELTHYYEKHAWKNLFASEIVDLNVSKNINSVQNQVLNETQADYLGGFLAYSAGFGLFEKGDSLIANLYQSYGLGENLDGYPSKSDRMVLSKRIAEKVKTLVDVFEMANLLSAIGKHHEAYLYYKYILNQYQSREIYNNLGVSAVMDAMTYFNKDSLKFSYVNEMDVQFRGSRDLANRKDSILKQAIFHFDAAISLDPDYSIAYLNKANAYALLNNLSKAKFYLEEEALPIVLKTKTNSKTLSDIHVLQGIIAAREGNNSLATTFFNKAIENNNQLGQINLDVLNNVPHEMVNVVRIPTFDDTISNMSLKAFTQKYKNVATICELEQENVFIQNDNPELPYRIFLNRDIPNKLFTTLLVSKANYKGQTNLGVKIGDQDEKIMKLYGNPKNIVETNFGSIWVYEDIIFQINQSNTVEKWINYITKLEAF